MDPRTYGLKGDDDLRNERALKMVSKYIAPMHYDIPLSDNPRSVTYRMIGGLSDLDRIDAHIPVLRPNAENPMGSGVTKKACALRY
jgi:hypothetical protein